jgi:phospholipid/cholesterol/gamma-HCH transport system substrate-binding protein
MERNANYFLVGIISSLLLVALFVFVVWLAGAGLSQKYDLYDIVFEGPVRGLAKGGEVHFNGIKVGDVRDIKLDPSNPQLVIARARVTSDVPIRKDSIAELEPQGITGVSYVQISAGTATQPLLKDTVGEDVVPRLSSRKDALSDLLANSGEILQRATQSLDSINRLLSTENIAKVSASLDDLHALTTELKARKSLIADAQTTLRDADQAVLQIKTLAASSNSLVKGQGATVATKLGATVDELQGAAKDLRAVLAKVQGPASDLTTVQLPQMLNTMTSVQRATEHLDEVLTELQQSPRGLVEKAPAKEIEVKP